jgi:uncharacterized protein DUF4255
VASFRAVAAVSRAMLRLIEDGCPRAEFPDAQFELQQTNEAQKPVMVEGITLCLYRAAINAACRNLPPRTDPDGRRFKPSIPLDLYYAVCAWGRSVDVQQRLFGRAIRTLEDTPILPAALLNLYGPEPATFRSQETVELVCDPVSMQDLNTLWEIQKPNVPLMLTYAARMVFIDSDVVLTEGPPVQVRAFDMAGVQS